MSFMFLNLRQELNFSLGNKQKSHRARALWSKQDTVLKQSDIFSKTTAKNIEITGRKILTHFKYVQTLKPYYTSKSTVRMSPATLFG